jgi:TRAP-type mannitol/chloroaromatic compound transport system substrate-binding protein
MKPLPGAPAVVAKYYYYPGWSEGGRTRPKS